MRHRIDLNILIISIIQRWISKTFISEYQERMITMNKTFIPKSKLKK